MVSTDDLHRRFKKPIIRPLKFRMAEIRHLENREVAISQQKKTSDFDKIWYTVAHLELDDSQMTKYEHF